MMYNTCLIGDTSPGRVGTGTTFVSTGSMTERVIDAQNDLAARGVASSLFHTASIKPFDAAGLVQGVEFSEDTLADDRYR